MKLSLPRKIAYDAFVEVMEHRKRPEDVLEDAYQNFAGQLSKLDRAFIKEILYGSLRWYSKIYWILQNISKRNLDDTTPQIRAALVCGAYQIYYMDRVPDRAAVNESVEYIREKSQANATRFINGILRAVARRAVYFPKPDKENKPAEYLSLQFAHPQWMVERWLKNFHFEKLEKMLAAHNQPPPLTIRVNTLKTPTEKVHELQQELLKNEHIHSEKRNLRCALRLQEMPPTDEGSLFAQGFYTFQDEASQLISFLVSPQPNEVIVDACSGPGGKLGHLYELSQGSAQFFAIERSKVQFTKMRQQFERMGYKTDRVTFIQDDFLSWEAPSSKVDRILLDAPCSGLGVLRRHPEGKWHKDASIISAMHKKQQSLIKHALNQLKVGGLLVYAVCSFEKEESLEHMIWLEQEFGDAIAIESTVSLLPDYFKRYVTRQNLLLIYSGNQDDMDGFAAFAVRRTRDMTF